MFTDFVLASLHHLLVFGLMAILAIELVLVRPGMDAAALRRVVRIDGIYGAMAVAVILVGIGRILYGLKGWEAYSGNVWFWHKMGVFVLVGLLSIPPTIRFARWNRAAKGSAGYTAPADEVRAVRRFLHAEAGLFLLIPVFAAAMARYGT